jgi:uncharacterized protein
MNVYQYKSSHGEVKDVDTKKGIVSGYFSHFGSKDADGDVIQQGAFTKSIKEAGPDSAKPRIKHFFNHNPGQPLGVIQTLQEDSTGLYYESLVGKHQLGVDFLKMVDSGLISEHSIGFKTLAEKSYKNDAIHGDYNLMTELKLWEGSSLSAWGANMNTPIVGVKGQEYDVVSKKVQLMEKFIKNSDASDETLELLLIQMKQLQQYIIDLQGTTKAATIAPQPEKKEDDELLQFLTKINSNF